MEDTVPGKAAQRMQLWRGVGREQGRNGGWADGQLDVQVERGRGDVIIVSIKQVDLAVR
jgi:hypothetical protein